MGKGDKKTRKGKIFRNSYGKSRLKIKPIVHKKWAKKRLVIMENSQRKDSNINNQAIFPILSLDHDGYFFIGTGFFINEFGWFITAKHVVKDNAGNTVSPLVIIQVINGNEFQQRNMHDYWEHPTADVVIGILEPMRIQRTGERLTNPTLVLMEKEVKRGKEIYTYAYPDSRLETPIGRWQMTTFSPWYYFGRVNSVINRNDSFVKGRCVQSNMLVKGGASGGPVLNNNGFVIGINTSGYDFGPKEEPLSFITPIQTAFDIDVPFDDNGIVRMIKLMELVEMGGIMTDRKFSLVKNITYQD